MAYTSSPVGFVAVAIEIKIEDAALVTVPPELGRRVAAQEYRRAKQSCEAGMVEPNQPLRIAVYGRDLGFNPGFGGCLRHVRT